MLIYYIFSILTGHESSTLSKNQSVSKLELLKQKKIDAKLAKQRAEIKRLKDKRKSANAARLNSGGSTPSSTKKKYGNAHENENIGHIKSAEQIRQAKIDAKLAKKREEIKRLKMKKKLSKHRDSIDTGTPVTPTTPASANSAHENSVTSKNQTVSKLELLKQKKIEAKLAKQRAEIKRLKDKRKSANAARLNGGGNTPSSSKKKYGNAHENANITKIKSAEQVRQAKIDAKLAKQREEIKRLKMKRKSQNKARLSNAGSNTPSKKNKFGNSHESSNVGKIKSAEQVRQAKIDAKLAKQREEIKRLKMKRKRENELGIKPQAKVKFGSAHESTNVGSKNNKVSKKERMKQKKIDKKLAAKRAEIKALKERRRLENEYKNGNIRADVMDSDTSIDETSESDISDEDAYRQVSSADDHKSKPKKYDDALDDVDDDDDVNGNDTPVQGTSSGSGTSGGSSNDSSDDDDDSLDSNASF